MEKERFRIIILGAGFSRLAGYPLGTELWAEILKRAKHLSGRAGKFHQDLKNYLEYKRNCDGKEITEHEVDFEDFMRVLDIEHFLNFRGKDTWSQDGNEGTIVVKTLIGQILAELTPSHNNIPGIYLEFASRLEPDDYVLTFNYDVLLERALDAVGKPYRLFPRRLQEGGHFIDNSKKEVIVLKLHGSIDWFDRGEYSQIEQQHRKAGIQHGPKHPVFCSTEDIGLTRLVDGPRHSNDALEQMHRVTRVEELYQKPLMFRATPWLLSPSAMKIVYASKVESFWTGFGNAGVLNFGVAIVGYSLPPQDEYARQAVYNLVSNFQGNYWDKPVFGKIKTPLVIVDYCKNEEQINALKSRYRFVDWGKACLHTEGFNVAAIDLIFRQA